MLTQKGENTDVVGIIGNFDDAQTGVKKMFNSKLLEIKMSIDGEDVRINSLLRSYFPVQKKSYSTLFSLDAQSSQGEYEITPAMREKLSCFAGGYATEEETKKNIKKVYDGTNYILDPHTSVLDPRCLSHIIIYMGCHGCMRVQNVVGAIIYLFYPVVHQLVCDKDEMQNTVENILGL
mgnify:CR=1 FL=1